jgi:hypothetical protein
LRRIGGKTPRFRRTDFSSGLRGVLTTGFSPEDIREEKFLGKGVFFFGYFLLDKQKKVTKTSGSSDF